jgi:SAM-dependent methyltransferase
MTIETVWRLIKTEMLNGMTLNDVVGGGDPEAIGQLSRTVVERVGAITPASKVLDIGCGCGRSAAALAPYLRSPGGFVGVDIIPALVNFCRREITSRYPNFQFYALRHDSEQYAAFIEQETETAWLEDLTALDRDFDLAIAFSLFTHLDASTAARMLDTLWHRLRDGGTAVLTFFVLNSYSRTGIAQGRSNVFGRMDVSGDIVIDTFNGPNSAVGYDEGALQKLILESPFGRPESIHYGTWSCSSGLHYQDVVVLRKNSAIPADFDPESYLSHNPDVRKTGMNPFFHYHLYGRQEGRRYKRLIRHNLMSTINPQA